MAITIYMGFVNKKLNSTKNPEQTTENHAWSMGYHVKGEFVDTADVLHPIVKMRVHNTDSQKTWNWCYIPYLNRCYFIDRWEITNEGFFIAYLRVDVLATYRKQIGESQMYILRSSAEYDGEINDNLFPMKSEVVRLSTALNCACVWGLDAYETGGVEPVGCYVLGIINNSVYGVGTVSYYCFTLSQLRVLMSKLMDSVSWMNISDITEELSQALLNPLQYIVSCKWYPVTPPNISLISGFRYGWWTLDDVPCYRIGSTYVHSYLAFQFTPKTNNYGKYKYHDTSPYMRAVLFAQPFGSFELPLTTERTMLYGHVTVDFISGNSLLTLSENSELPFFCPSAYREGSIGVDVQLSQMSTNVLKVAQDTVSTAGGFIDNLIHGNFGGAISNLASGVVSVVQDAIPTMATRGHNGSGLDFFGKPFVLYEMHQTVEEDVERFGKPLCKKRVIKNIPGYILCANPSIELQDAFPAEIAEINKFLSEGFFYE